MISITMPDLEVNQYDAKVIQKMYRAELKKKGYTGPVMVSVNRLYEIHKDSSKQIARMWIKICANAKN